MSLTSEDSPILHRGGRLAKAAQCWVFVPVVVSGICCSLRWSFLVLLMLARVGGAAGGDRKEALSSDSS